MDPVSLAAKSACAEYVGVCVESAYVGTDIKKNKERCVEGNGHKLGDTIGLVRLPASVSPDLATQSDPTTK